MNKKLIVITGRSSCGKSTLIKELSKKGYNTLPEIPRTVLSLRKDFPNTLEEGKVKQNLIYNMQLAHENFCEGLVYLERSLIDIFTFGNYLNTLPKNFNQNLCFNRYDKIFSLDCLPFINDGIRIEKDENEAQVIYDYALKNYNDFGYKPINVPKFSDNKNESIERRVKFILENI